MSATEANTAFVIHTLACEVCGDLHSRELCGHGMFLILNYSRALAESAGRETEELRKKARIAEELEPEMERR